MTHLVRRKIENPEKKKPSKQRRVQNNCKVKNTS
jgi:hypothetical protein